MNRTLRSPAAAAPPGRGGARAADTPAAAGLPAGLGYRTRGRPAASNVDSPPAVVVGLDCVTGLQTARTLRSHGIGIVGVAANLAHPCCRTRVCDRIIHAATADIGLIEALLAAGPTLPGPAVLVPCTDLSVLLVSRHRDELAPWFRIALPDPDVVELLVDKGRFYAFAHREGLPIPATVLLHCEDDAAEAARDLRFPVVLKPAVKTAQWKRISAAKAYRLDRPEDLLPLYRRLAGASDCLVVQEWIEGADTDHYTCNAYFSRESEPLVTFTTRKLRQWPPFGGEACLGVECRNETVLAETVRLFGRVRHRGFAYLEMKRDARTGRHLIIEPNIGRPTGRSGTAEAAGVELLYTMYCDVLGWPLPERRRQEYRGVKWIHFRRDFQSALHHWRRGDLTFSAWLRSIRGPKTEALFSWRDPAPFWADLARVGVELVRGGNRTGRRVDAS